MQSFNDIQDRPATTRDRFSSAFRSPGALCVSELLDLPAHGLEADPDSGWIRLDGVPGDADGCASPA